LEDVPFYARVESSHRPPAPLLSLEQLLTTPALKASGPPMPLTVLRYLDLAVLVLALPIFVAADLPMLGWAGAAVGWGIQRVVQVAIERRARASDDPRTVAGLLTGSMLARGWIMAGSIFIVGLSEREAGLAAAILAITLFTFYFTSQMLTRPFEGKRS
jgi:hypothetical protein